MHRCLLSTPLFSVEHRVFERTGGTPVARDVVVHPGIPSERMYAFVASGLMHVGQRLGTTERIEVEVVNLDSAQHWLVNGDLADGKTMAVLGMYLARQCRVV